MSRDGAPAGWLEFSTSVNPLGTPAHVADAMARTSYATAADLDPAEAVAQLAADAGVDEESVLLTAGVAEATRLVVSTFAQRRNAVVVGPADSPFARDALRSDSELTSFVAEPPSFDPPWEEAARWLRDHPGVLFVGEPNDPTGRTTGRGARHLLDSRFPLGTRIIIDQSFAPFARPSVTAADCVNAGNAILIRSLGPVLAIPGVPLAYLIAEPRSITALRAQQGSWTVGAHALAVARVASFTLADDQRARILSWRARLATGLALLGLEPLPSEANFVLVHVGPSAEALVDAMAEARIAVRWCASFELPEYIRVAVRPPDEQERLFAALAAARQRVGW